MFQQPTSRSCLSSPTIPNAAIPGSASATPSIQKPAHESSRETHSLTEVELLEFIAKLANLLLKYLFCLISFCFKVYCLNFYSCFWYWLLTIDIDYAKKIKVYMVLSTSILLMLNIFIFIPLRYQILRRSLSYWILFDIICTFPTICVRGLIWKENI